MFDLGDETTGRSSTMAVGEQPPQRLENFGVNAVSDTELLAMILQGNGVRTDQPVDLASRLIGEAGLLAGLISWTAADYRRMKGIGRITGLQLGAIAEIARRMMMAQRPTPPVLNRPELIAAHFAATVAGLQVEKFWVLCLNRKQRLLKQVEVTSGTATAALAHPRSLCKNHHWALDQRLIAPDPARVWRVSRHVEPRRSRGEDELARLAGQPLLAPVESAFAPDRVGLEWRLERLLS